MRKVLENRTPKVSNSRGVRIPKQAIIRPSHRIRSGWDTQFCQMAAQGDDQLLDGFTSNSWDDEEWEW